MSTKKRILFFYLKTGGGHFAPVRAVEEFLRTAHPESVEPILVDGMEKAGGFARYIIEDGYRITQARARWVYEAAYAVTKFPPATRANSALVAAVLRPGLEETIIRLAPDGIVISHFFLIAPILDILRARKLSVPTTTIVTDPYTAHPLWFLRKDQTMVVFSERLKESAVRRGIPPGRVHVFPFILGPGFSGAHAAGDAAVSKSALRFRPDQKVVLLVGGGDGMPRGFRIVKAILGRLPDAGVILVCGRNKSLYERVARLLQAEEGKNLRLFGYVENIPELIRLSDAVLTKGGASTLMEILALGKIPIVTAYIWEQEKGNVEFVVREGRGLYEKRIGEIPKILAGIFSDAPAFRRIRETNERRSIESGTAAVAEFIVRRTEG